MKRVFALFDVKAEVFGNPMFVPNQAVMVRELTDEVRRMPVSEGNNLAKHPEDFQLFDLGEFDEVAGTFALLKPRFLLEVSALAVRVVDTAS